MNQKSQSQKSQNQEKQNGLQEWESELKEKFLNYYNGLGLKPTRARAESYLYGDNGSMEEAEEEIPSWYYELPDE